MGLWEEYWVLIWYPLITSLVWRPAVALLLWLGARKQESSSYIKTYSITQGRIKTLWYVLLEVNIDQADSDTNKKILHQLPARIAVTYT